MNLSSANILNGYRSLILDTSVIINLHKSNFGDQIIHALPYTLATTNDVWDELEQGKSKGHDSHVFLSKILKRNYLKLIELNQEERKLRREFESSNSDYAVGRGEASVIAVCKYRFTGKKYLPVIDDKKGRDKVKEQLDDLGCGCSLDLFLHPLVKLNLSEDVAANALYNALKHAHMSVPLDRSVMTVIDFIGEKRAKECVSLPGFKSLFD